MLKVKNVRNLVGIGFRGDSLAWKSMWVKTQALLNMTFIKQNCYKV